MFALLFFILPFTVAWLMVGAYTYRRQCFTNALPSLSWLVFLIIPFGVTIAPFASDAQALTLQITGLSIIGITLLAGDFLSAKLARSPDNHPHARGFGRLNIKQDLRLKDSHSSALLWGAWALSAITLIGIAAHILRIGVENTPLISALLFDVRSEEALDHMRDLFSRDADLTFIEKYFYNFSVLLFGLPALVYFLATKRFAVALILFFVFTFYLLASMAKMPFMIFFTALSLLIIHIAFPKYKNRILMSLAVCGTVFIIIGGLIRAEFPHFFVTDAFKDQHPACTVITEKIKPACTSEMMIGDYYRIPYYTEIGRPDIARYYDYIIYRMFLTPVEVNYRWYEYFQDDTRRDSFATILPFWRGENYEHPARTVDKFAYESRFPYEYAWGYAYGSIDADAYARGGLQGIAIVAALLLIMRLLPTLSYTGYVFSEIYGLILIALLVILLPSASIQALLVAHGALPICGLLVLLYLYRLYQVRSMKAR